MMEKQGRVMLDRWADRMDERRIILAFWEHLESIGYDRILDVYIEKELDRYHGINQPQLEQERRQLLEAAKFALAKEKASE